MASTLDAELPSKASSRVSAPVVRVRDPRLDFYRGIAMFIILFAHTPGNFFTSWIPARWGFSDATEMFVFCSGMASAIAFGGAFDRAGWRLGTARVGYRVWQVYWAHIGMFVIIAGMLAAIDLAAVSDTVYIGTLNLWRFFSDPGPQLVGLLTLTYVPNYFDILPMYMVVLVMIPLVMALSRVNLWLLAGMSLALWFFAQGALLDWVGLGYLHLSLPAEPWSDRRWFFNPFGWQLVFFTGFAFMRGWIPAPPLNRVLVGLSLVIVLANVPLSNIGVREFGFDWAREWRMENRGWFSKTDFGILRYVQFLALAYLGYAVAGDGGRNLIVTGTGIFARFRATAIRLTTKVGQQSLAVFLFSMVLARFTGFVLDQLGRDVATVTLANLIGMALLVCVAYSVSWFKRQPWRGVPAR
ncbi:OpgC family protein [Rhodophyticola porphyridii]|uniref:OpgC domain-containing protein n=1 Tax=Rhodophyticola porphyridii TaxID=1852017 RepID=A0A3L9XX38_9RHOB|nr:OpgC domain-containing protein [Rhodophyticola porphyridii]RMA40872.1 OpgC domain-containing protein [Rhodophyticola porphyridii]